MCKFPLLLIILHLLSGCTAFENDANNKLYNSFEDDFFGSSEGGVSASESDNETIENEVSSDARDGFSSMNKFDDSNLGSDRKNNSSAVNAINSMSPVSNGFVGDNYMFSFSVTEGESLKSRMQDLLEPYGYKLIWKSEYEIYFENDVLYEDKLLVNVLKNISADLVNMGIDIHINVYLKNKVVLVYSVRS